MVDDLFGRVRERTVDAVWALIKDEDLRAVLEVFRCNELAHLVLVVVNRRVSTQPAAIDFSVGESAELVVVVVALGTPRASESTDFIPG
jgi:hypothetical protein